MGKWLKYIFFCICYPLKRWQRERWEKANDDGWNGYRKAESEEWGRTIAHRMFSPDGDIYQAVEQQKENRGKISGYLIDGEDVFTMYENMEKTFRVD